MEARLAAFIVHAVAICTCPQNVILTVPLGATAKCPACGQDWRIEKINFLERQGDLEKRVTFEVEVVPQSRVLSAGPRIFQ